MRSVPRYATWRGARILRERRIDPGGFPPIALDAVARNPRLNPYSLQIDADGIIYGATYGSAPAELAHPTIEVRHLTPRTSRRSPSRTTRTTRRRTRSASTPRASSSSDPSPGSPDDDPPASAGLEGELHGGYSPALAAKFIALQAWMDALSPEAFLEAEARIVALIEGES